ncbi:MAG: ABC transporter ATP-binding protein [Burkholderiaceae bacterium]|nr:ABC transporter ATP-binding protein [Burkholderiaceae bacterium]
MGTETEPATGGEPLLELRDVVAGYGKLVVLDGTSFAVPRGRITTLIGPNGAGKSTVFKAVFGLLRVQRGQVRLDGADATNLGPRALLERGLSYIPQGRNVFPELTVLHNLELGATAAPRGVDVGARIEAVMERFPVLRHKALAQAGTLSGGQLKQLEIARGLLLEPRLMLVDEPSIGLSPKLVRETFEILQALRARGMTILMVEQNARSALAISDWCVVLELGRSRLVGPARTILEDPRVGSLFLGGGLAPPAGEAA